MDGTGEYDSCHTVPCAGHIQKENTQNYGFCANENDTPGFFRRCLGFSGDVRAIQYTRARKICPCVWKGAFGGRYPKKLNYLGGL